MPQLSRIHNIAFRFAILFTRSTTVRLMSGRTALSATRNITNRPASAPARLIRCDYGNERSAVDRQLKNVEAVVMAGDVMHLPGLHAPAQVHVRVGNAFFIHQPGPDEATIRTDRA